MRKYNKYLVAGLVLSLLSFSTNALANEENNSSTDTVSKYSNDNNDFSVNSVVERDNDFCITSDSENYWKKVSFKIDLYSVTPRQPFSGIDPKNQPLDKSCVRVRSGRKKSHEVMSWVHEFKGEEIPAITYVPSDQKIRYPYYANFAFTGTLTLINKNYKVFTCNNVLIGQSNSIVSNLQGNPNIWFMYSNIGSSWRVDKKGSSQQDIIAVLQCDTQRGNKVNMHISKDIGTFLAKHYTFTITLQQY